MRGGTLTVPQVAALVGASIPSVYRWYWSGVLPPPERLGNVLVWDREAIEGWLQHRSRLSPAAKRLTGRLHRLARQIRRLGLCPAAIAAAMRAEAEHAARSQPLAQGELDRIIASVTADSG